MEGNKHNMKHTQALQDYHHAFATTYHLNATTKTMTIHDLKILPPYFDDVANGHKTFEIRFNDRSFSEEDVLLLREIISSTRPEYTGRKKAVEVTYITDYGQKDGYVVMGIKII